MHIRRSTFLILLLAAVSACTDRSDSSDSASSGSENPVVFELIVVRSLDDEAPSRLEGITAQGGSSTIPTPDEGDATEPDVTSDGSAVVYAVTDDTYTGSLWVTSLADRSAEPEQIPIDGKWVCPRWFPDGERIVALDGDREQPAVIDVATGEQTPVPLPNDAAGSSCVDPSPDGSRLAVAIPSDDPDYPDYVGETWTLNVDGTDARPVGAVPSGCITNFPAWSPNGEMIAVDSVCTPQEHNGIWVIDVSSGDTKPLVAENPTGLELGEGLQYWGPSWISNESVVFHRVPGHQSGDPQIWSAHLDGKISPVVESDAVFPAAVPGDRA